MTCWTALMSESKKMSVLHCFQRRLFFVKPKDKNCPELCILWVCDSLMLVFLEMMQNKAERPGAQFGGGREGHVPPPLLPPGDKLCFVPPTF